MPWLVVLGNGSWQAEGTLYRAGKHLVPEEVADRARASGIRRLVVLEEEPTLAQPTGGPLELEHVRRGVQGVSLAERQPEAVEGGTPGWERPAEYPCPSCPKSFPSSGALARHEEFNHAVPVQTAPDAADGQTAPPVGPSGAV